MKAILAVFAIGLMLAGAFAGCIGGEEELVVEKCAKCGNDLANCTCNQTIVVDFSTIMAQAPTEATNTSAHWKIIGGADFFFQYSVEGVPLPTNQPSKHLAYDLNLPEGVAAIEVLVDWESTSMDLDLYFLRNGKDIGVTSSQTMINDPMVMALGNDGTTWEYITAICNKTKKFAVPEKYTIDLDIFNNWDYNALAGTQTPFTIDVWVYTERPEKFHDHQEVGQ